MREFSRAQPHVISPEELEADGGGALVLASAVPLHALVLVGPPVFKVNQPPVDLTGGDAAEGQPRGEFCAKVEAQEAVAGVFVVRHGCSGEEMLSAFVCFARSAEKGMCGFDA